MASSGLQSDASSSDNAWVWNGNEDPFDKSMPPTWKNYSDLENIIIEEAYNKHQPSAKLDKYYIDFKRNLQIFRNDPSKIRQVKRTTEYRNSNHLREGRFTHIPLNPKQPFAGLYGWISPFIKEVVRDLNITRDRLPSKDQQTRSLVINRAATGFIEEGKLLERKCEGEILAEMLLSVKNDSAQKVWDRCAYLYSLECFLYKKLNETMRLIGSQEHEQNWRSKVRTLGPFALLLWDNPSNTTPTPPGTTLYRGADLPIEAISAFIDDCSKEDKPMRSFPSFTSCSRNQAKAEDFGNVLFHMNIKHAFTVDVKPFSKYPDEEEELLSPGCCFIIKKVEKKSKDKYWVYVDVIQQHRRKLFCFGHLLTVFSREIHY